MHHELQDSPLPHKTLFHGSLQNKMFMHYNRIVIGSFKEFFQADNMNNLTEVLQALKELNFMLANHTLELALHYNLPLELHQNTAEEVPDLLKAHLHHTTTYNPEHSVRGRPHFRGNQYISITEVQPAI